MKRSILVVMLGLSLVGMTAWALTSKNVDIDGDGYQEAEVFYSDGKIVRTFVDLDHDGHPDGTIHYRDGYRDHARIDTNGDGLIDTWASYYFTGVPWKIAEDLDRDGKPDYWSYYKNGKLYRWEQDRNRDEKADIRTTYLIDGAGNRRTLVEQSYDDDFDGSFESLSGVTMVKREASFPHSLAEALLK